MDEVQVPSQRLDLDQYTDGLYLIKIWVEGNEVVTKKLLLKR